MAAYCQTWARWVEAEKRLAETPAMVKTPSGHIQQNPWLPVANKQLELMGRYMSELGLTPAARSRLQTVGPVAQQDGVSRIERIVVVAGEESAADELRRRIAHLAERNRDDSSR